ncbi:hypothetical protein HALLA_20875 (plasmid) [Halostagnicola larsenii XH-48]|uniref:Acetyl xylan esterase domain-containing protein n=1 Tax=Halostagnicola larsenii XH-48 TaxID=797299 RepID=W0JYT9_9EURY|nr:hypothetical protein [Halostagnicola larsenii]AHG02360.1 hypothetical protein HALLA_20875 [Halostagnicola larsenii XH-48]
MNGFNEAVNASIDVEDQLSRYLWSLSEAEFADERIEKQAIGSRAGFETRRERIQARFLESIGGLPDRMDDPSIELHGRTARDGYSIERITLESRPNIHVTTNCYVPDGDGPFPGIVFLCGHIDSPKSDLRNQKACIELALNGFVVLIVDPISQGERTQYFDPETGKPVFDERSSVIPHSHAGQKCFYAGASLARYMIHDDRCALDYLAARPDVDEERIGVIGASGGGIQTLFLSMVDDRIAAAAPCCSVTERREQQKTGKCIDAEQLVYGAIARGVNYDDLLTTIAPRPVCIGAAVSDEHFPIEGVYETVDRAREIYGFYDATENVQLVVADTTHCPVSDLRDGVFAFLCDHLTEDEYEPKKGLSTLEKSALECTQTGHVMTAYPDERTIDDLIREYVANAPADDSTESVVGDNDGDADQFRTTLLERFDLERDDCDLSPRYIDRTVTAGLEIEHVWFRTERDPDIVVTGLLVSDPDSDTSSPAVVLYEDGTEELPDRSEEVASLAEEYGTVFVFDPRGIGAVQHRRIPVHSWVDDYDGVYGTEFKLGYDALMLESSLLEMRVFDVCRAAEFLRSETNATNVSFVGDGIGAYHALYAAAATENVDRVDVYETVPSFATLATEQDADFHPQLTAFDVIRSCDIPQVERALEQREVKRSQPPIE